MKHGGITILINWWPMIWWGLPIYCCGHKETKTFYDLEVRGCTCKKASNQGSNALKAHWQPHLPWVLKLCDITFSKTYKSWCCHWVLTTRSLCVIFTILVSFSRDNALYASKAKINVVWNFFERSSPKGVSGVRKKISNNIDFSLWGNRATTQNTFFDIFKWYQNH